MEANILKLANGNYLFTDIFGNRHECIVGNGALIDNLENLRTACETINTSLNLIKKCDESIERHKSLRNSEDYDEEFDEEQIKEDIEFEEDTKSTMMESVEALLHTIKNLRR